MSWKITICYIKNTLFFTLEYMQMNSASVCVFSVSVSHSWHFYLRFVTYMHYMCALTFFSQKILLISYLWLKLKYLTSKMIPYKSPINVFSLFALDKIVLSVFCWRKGLLKIVCLLNAKLCFQWTNMLFEHENVRFCETVSLVCSFNIVWCCVKKSFKVHMFGLIRSLTKYY